MSHLLSKAFKPNPSPSPWSDDEFPEDDQVAISPSTRPPTSSKHHKPASKSNRVAAYWSDDDSSQEELAVTPPTKLRPNRKPYQHIAPDPYGISASPKAKRAPVTEQFKRPYRPALWAYQKVMAKNRLSPNEQSASYRRMLARLKRAKEEENEYHKEKERQKKFVAVEKAKQKKKAERERIKMAAAEQKASEEATIKNITSKYQAEKKKAHAEKIAARTMAAQVKLLTAKKQTLTATYEKETAALKMRFASAAVDDVRSEDLDELIQLQADLNSEKQQAALAKLDARKRKLKAELSKAKTSNEKALDRLKKASRNNTVVSASRSDRRPSKRGRRFKHVDYTLHNNEESSSDSEEHESEPEVIDKNKQSPLRRPTFEPIRLPPDLFANRYHKDPPKGV